MKREKVFVEPNTTGIFDYCERALNFSRAQSYYFKSVAEKSEEVPELKISIVQGTLTLSQARRIVPVITPQNQELWITKAQTLTQRELEREVTEMNPKAHIKETIKPVAPRLSELKVGITVETESQLKRLQEIYSQKKKRFVPLSEVVALIAQNAIERESPEKKLERAKKRKALTPSQSKPVPQISLGKLNPQSSSPADSIQSHSETFPPISSRNPTPLSTSSRTRVPIPQKTRTQLLVDAKNQCTYQISDGKRCPQRLWLELHHLKPISQGGGNQKENLRFLCSSHHKYLHRAGLSSRRTDTPS
ncbi:MAG: HNH endonuclease [Deltaproteobacteria bacterium]